MPALTTELIRTLLTSRDAPCVSIYLPTHRSYPDSQQDPIRYRNLVDAVEQSLREKYPGRDVRALLERFRALTGDREFWNHTHDGLAVLGTADRFEVVKLPRKAPELAVVADSFHLKPLLRFVQSADRFHVLCVSQTQASVFEGDRYGLVPADLDGFPASLTDALGEELTDPYRGSGRGPQSPSPQGSGTTYYGQGARKDELDKDTDRYFRAVDRAMWEKFSEPAKLPVVLVGLPENLSEFRKRARNQYLLAEGVAGDPGSFGHGELSPAVWKVVEPQYLARLARLTENYQTALGTGLASGDPATIAPAAMDGRVGLLLVDADKVVPGRIDRDARTVRTDRLENPEVDDVLDDLAELVLNTGGDVVVVPSGRMPSDTGVAAVYRY